nr:hypothetical protein [Tanacetum cinerariifolium]
METKDTLFLCLDSDEIEAQRLQKKVRIMKDSFQNGISVLKSRFTLLSKRYVPSVNESEFEHTFNHIFGEDVHKFTKTFSRNTTTLETQLTNKTLHESNYKTTFRELKTPFEKIFTSKLIKSSQLDECKVQEVKASDASSRDKDSSGIVSDKWNDQNLENKSNTTGDESSRSRNEDNDKSTSGDDTDIRPSYYTELMAEVPYTAEYNVFVVDSQHSEQHESINDTHRVALANLIANLKLDIDENQNIQKQLKKANASLTQELKECKSTLEETNRTLREANSTRDKCLITLQNKKIELEKYKTYLNRTNEHDTLARKLKETQTVLAQKENHTKEGLKLKAYEISVVKKEHDELVKHSLITKSRYEGPVKEKNQVIKDLKLKEENDIDKMITIEKQLKFLNEIVYKQNQSIQSIHMLALKGSTYNMRPTFENPMYHKKAQSEKPCLYEISYDTSDLANRFTPDREETLTLEQESRSKLNKDLVNPYDYTK